MKYGAVQGDGQGQALELAQGQTLIRAGGTIRLSTGRTLPLITLVSIASVSAAFAAEPLPSLDELLGIAGDTAEQNTGEGQTGAERTTEPLRDELDRRLSGEQATDALDQALQLMRDTTGRLSRANGTGIETQRLQEDILKRLDTVIASAEQQQQQQNSQSSSSQQQQQQQSQNQPSQQQSRSRRSSASTAGEAEHVPGSTQETGLGPETIADGAAWGALPDRLRDSLVEGVSDRFSSIYQRMTEAYYRRLAEEGGGE